MRPLGADFQARRLDSPAALDEALRSHIKCLPEDIEHVTVTGIHSLRGGEVSSRILVNRCRNERPGVRIERVSFPDIELHEPIPNHVPALGSNEFQFGPHTDRHAANHQRLGLMACAPKCVTVQGQLIARRQEMLERFDIHRLGRRLVVVTRVAGLDLVDRLDDALPVVARTDEEIQDRIERVIVPVRDKILRVFLLLQDRTAAQGFAASDVFGELVDAHAWRGPGFELADIGHSYVKMRGATDPHFLLVLCQPYGRFRLSLLISTFGSAIGFGHFGSPRSALFLTLLRVAVLPLRWQESFFQEAGIWLPKG